MTQISFMSWGLMSADIILLKEYRQAIAQEKAITGELSQSQIKAVIERVNLEFEQNALKYINEHPTSFSLTQLQSIVNDAKYQYLAEYRLAIANKLSNSTSSIDCSRY